jgi:hypothetical protein
MTRIPLKLKKNQLFRVEVYRHFQFFYMQENYKCTIEFKKFNALGQGY